MNRSPFLHIALLLAFAADGAIGALAPPSEGEPEQLREAVLWLTGSFSNQAQAKQNSAFHAVVLHMQPIWTARAGEHWLYVEQALAATPEKPYRQRVYRVQWDGDGPVSEVYTLPGDGAAYVGAWRTTGVFASLTPDDLRRKEGCSLHLAKSLDGSYRGATRGQACASERSGASYATSEVVLEPALISTLDRGFDTNGVQAWGSQAGPYRFDRVHEERPAPP